MMKGNIPKWKITVMAAALWCAPAASQAQAVTQAVPDTGIGPAPTGVVPGGVVPVPAPSTTPTPDLTPSNPISPPIGAMPPPVQRPVGAPSFGISPVNTFTEQQVRSSLMAQGYTGISGLTVDGAGTWRGTAVRNGSNIPVTVDSNGIVTPH